MKAFWYFGERGLNGLSTTISSAPCPPGTNPAADRGLRGDGLAFVGLLNSNSSRPNPLAKELALDLASIFLSSLIARPRAATEARASELDSMVEERNA